MTELGGTRKTDFFYEKILLHYSFRIKLSFKNSLNYRRVAFTNRFYIFKQKITNIRVLDLKFSANIRKRYQITITRLLGPDYDHQNMNLRLESKIIK